MERFEPPEDQDWVRVSGPTIGLIGLPAVALGFVVFVVFMAAAGAPILFVVLAAVMGTIAVTAAVARARSFVAVHSTEVLYRNRFRTVSLPLEDVVRFEVVRVAGPTIAIVPDDRALGAPCVAVRLRSGELIRLLATLPELLSPSSGTRAVALCRGLQENLQRHQTGRPADAHATGASWMPDPTGRHELRWWDGTQWTADVADQGATSTDAT